MLELWIALAIFLALVLIGAAVHVVQGHVLLMIGGTTAAIGITAGVVVGIRYHVALYRALRPRGLLGPRWWWRPTSYHGRLPSADKRAVMSWFYAGVASMAVALAGCAIMAAGILAM